ncbi:MAG: hypothetical protein IH612_20160, partial [Desulfofustis sp.]|nr:hypothetical protein [Desulfofustis sp.]
VRLYLINVDTHDIDGNLDDANGSIQYYRYQDDDWDGVAEFGEGNDRVDYGELIRDTTPPSDIVTKKNFVRTTSAASKGDMNLNIQTTGATVPLGSTFKVQGDSLDHKVLSGSTPTKLVFTPGLGVNVVSGAKVTFSDRSIGFNRTYLDEKQNIVNWYSYYRKREFTAKAAVGKFISEAADLNIGIHSIQDRVKQPVVSVKPTKYDSVTCTAANDYCDNTSSLLRILYTNYNSDDGGTPLRRGFERVGRYFDADDDNNGVQGQSSDNDSGVGSNVDSPYTVAINGAACQQSFAIVMTDGYYNGGDPTQTGNYDGDGNTAFDGGVYKDVMSRTMADIAMYYYEKDLAPGLADQVPKNEVDQNAQQHMVTYGIAFGVVGTLPPEPPGSCPPACNWPVGSSYTNPQGTFNEQQKIDDLLHATANGRGEFFTSASAQELVDALLKIKNDIEVKTGSGAAVGITPSGQLSTETVVFQGIYDPTNWSGDINAYGLVTLSEFIADQKKSPELRDNVSIGDVKTPALWTAGDTMKLIRDFDSQWWHDDGTGQSYIRQVVSYNPGIIASGLLPRGVAFDLPANTLSPTSTEFNRIQLEYFGPNALAADDAATKALKQANQLAKINYFRGDTSNEQPNGFAWRGRDGEVFGDFIHSAPNLVYTTVAALGDGDGVDNDKDGIVDELGEREPKLLVGANDGGLHVLNPDDKGKEMLFYIPNLVFPTLSILTTKNPDYDHQYYVDNTIHARRLDDKNAATVDPMLAVGGLGKGGKGYYALNLAAITAGTGETRAGDIVKWEYPNPNLLDMYGNKLEDTNGYMGYSYSMGYIVASNAADADYMVVFGNGYESPSGKAVLIILGLNADGSIKWRRELNT